MLIGHDVILVIGVYRLMLWWNVDFFSWQLKAREVFEQVGVMRLVEMEEGEGGVARLSNCQQGSYDAYLNCIPL